MTTARRDQLRHEVSVAGGALHVREWRSGSTRDAPPLVLLHGFTGAARSWEQLVALLAYRGRVLAPDLPGHGASQLGADTTHYAIESVSTALDVALTALDAACVTLVGYSMGGRLALYYTLTRPARVSRLVLESASAGIFDQAERETRVRADDELARYALEHGVERFVDRWERTPVLATQLGLPAADRARLREIRLASAAEGLAQSLRGMGSGAQPYLGSRLDEIGVPTLLLAGANDAKFSALARGLAAGICGAKLTILENVGHTPHLEDPTRWVDVVGGFINSGLVAA